MKPRRFSRASEGAAKRYSTDLSDQEWELIRSLLLPHAIGCGRKREVDERGILNAIFYQIHNGYIWSDLPKDLPTCQTVYKYFRRWQTPALGADRSFALGHRAVSQVSISSWFKHRRLLLS